MGWNTCPEPGCNQPRWRHGVWHKSDDGLAWVSPYASHKYDDRIINLSEIDLPEDAPVAHFTELGIE